MNLFDENDDIKTGVRRKHYGIVYMGSKNQIVDELFKYLPSGNRFCDLFGGGFACSHYALESGKYKKVLYNDINTLLVDLIKRALKGEFNKKPEFITREKFRELKDVDGYVKYIWSFGCKGDAYMYGADVEKLKEMAHNYVVFDVLCDELKEILGDFRLTGDDKNVRLYQFKVFIKEKIEKLAHIENLERLQNLEITNQSYEKYVYQDGDVVYCDIPYENTAEYSDGGFNHKKFYDWVMAQPYQIFISSYNISDPRFYVMDLCDKRSLLSKDGNYLVNTERLYSNKEFNIKKGEQFKLW